MLLALPSVSSPEGGEYLPQLPPRPAHRQPGPGTLSTELSALLLQAGGGEGRLSVLG